ncbi:MAG: membrane integrity-associated transporter subunit PqiC [Magnetococcales bacterium]|nr:membrane integrity-associated transporter subunit PqiC [Magnetococcales bacterium]MBF0438333.1 membrane integrity-associated transporter subunit PqiC [Magnetococcales bacterium]
MMLRHGLLALFWMVSSLLLNGCLAPASSPTRFFLLTALPMSGKTEVKQGLVVELEPVEIPQYLKRPEMVTRTGGNRLQLERLYQWAGDLKEDIGRVLMENLSQILVSDRVVNLPNRSDSPPNFRVLVSLNRFEPDETGQVLLDARWSLFDGKDLLIVTRHSRITAQASDSTDYEALAAAMSKALGVLSQEMGEGIRFAAGQK